VRSEISSRIISQRGKDPEHQFAGGRRRVVVKI
jgi:hypothetical protein